MKAVKTHLSVSEINSFQRFLEHHQICGVFVGVYGKRINDNRVDNFIQYVYDDDNDTMGAIVSLSLRFGSLEKAFLLVRYTEREVEEMIKEIDHAHTDK
jgi:hypothetical protein